MRKHSSYSLLILAFLTATALITAGCHHGGWGHGAGFYYGHSSPSVYYTPKTYYSTHHIHTTTLVRPGPIVHHVAPHPGHVVKLAPAPKPKHAGKPGPHPSPGPKSGHGGNIHARPAKHPGDHQTNLIPPGNRTPRPTPPTHMERPSGSRPPAKPSENIIGGRPQPSFSPGKHRDSPESPAPGKRGENRRS